MLNERAFKSAKDALDYYITQKKELHFIIPAKGQTKDECLAEEKKKPEVKENWVFGFMDDTVPEIEKAGNVEIVAVNSDDNKSNASSKKEPRVNPQTKSKMPGPEIPGINAPFIEEKLGDEQIERDSKKDDLAPHDFVKQRSVNVAKRTIRADIETMYGSNFKTGFPTMIKWLISPKGDHIAWTTDDSARIKKWNTIDEFYESKIMLVEQILQKFDGIYIDNGREHFQNFNFKMPDSSTCGMNWKKLYEDVSKSDSLYTGFMAGGDTVRAYAVMDKEVDKRVIAYLHPVERDIITFLHRANLAESVPNSELWNWLSKFDNDVWYLKSLNQVIGDKEKMFFWSFPSKLCVLQYYLDTYHNMRDFVLQVTTSTVEEFVMIPTKAVINEVSSLASICGIEMGKFGDANKIPSEIANGDGMRLAHQILYVSMNGRYLRLTAKLPEAFHFTTLFGCVVLKLIVSDWMLSASARLQIDNYIAVHLLLPLLTPQHAGRLMKEGVVPGNIRKEEDLMSKFENFQGSIATLLMFLRTVVGVSGWANATNRAGDAIVHFAAPSKFVNSRNGNVHYIRFFGMDMSDGDVVPEQFKRYMLFVLALDSFNFNWTKYTSSKRLQQAFKTLVGSFVTLGRTFNMIGRYMDAVMALIGMSSLSHPFEHGVDLPEQKIREVPITIIDSYAFIHNLSWTDFISYKVDFGILYYGWKVHEYLETVTYFLSRFEVLLPHLYTSRKLRVKRAIEFVPDVVGLRTLLMDNLGGTSILETLDVRPIQDKVPEILTKKREFIWRIINDNCALFGFLPHYYIMRNADDIIKPRNRCLGLSGYYGDVERKEYIDAQGVSEFSVTMAEMIVKKRRGLLSDDASRMQLAKGNVMKVIAPVWIVEQEYNDIAVMSAENHIGWDFAASPPVCTGILTRWRWADTFVPLDRGHGWLPSLHLARVHVGPTQWTDIHQFWNFYQRVMDTKTVYYKRINIQDLLALERI